MKIPRVFSSVCVAVVVMLLLSLTVHPVMAAEATKEQFASFDASDIGMITVDELVPDMTGELVTASSADDIQEYQSEKAMIRIKDPMADQHSPDVSALSASSVGDEVAAAIPGAVGRMDSEGYDLTGQSEHQYKTSIESEKFGALDSRQRALLEAADLHVEAGKSTAVTGQGDVQYYFFTNRTTGATRVMTVSQRIDHEGRLIGERNLVLLDDIKESDAGTANDGSSLSASTAESGDYGYTVWQIMMIVGGATEVTTVGVTLIAILLGSLGMLSGPALPIICIILLLIGSILLITGFVGNEVTSDHPKPTPAPTASPPSGIDTVGNVAAPLQ